MKLHQRFILDIWKASAYYDFEQSFKVPDTFYLHEKKIDWIFTGKNGKILKKKTENSTVSIVKDYFCNLEKNELENENNESSIVVGSQFLVNSQSSIAYFHYLDLSEICELLVNSFKKQDHNNLDDYDQDHIHNFYSQQNTQSDNISLNQNDYLSKISSQKHSSTETNQNNYDDDGNNELKDKTIMIQKFMKDNNEKNMIKVNWNINGKFSAEKRLNNYESFRKEDDYKSYIIFEDEDLSVNRELSLKEKELLLQICQHISNSMNLIHSERGKVTKLTLLLKQIQNNNTFYLIGCPGIFFENDSSLPQLWRISYDLKLKYPNSTIHQKNTLKEAENCVKKLENQNKIQQCNCCKNFSTKLQSISSCKLIQIRMRRGIGISQYEARQLKKKDFSDICEVCYQIFIEIHKINNFHTQGNSQLTENSFTTSKISDNILNSHRSSSIRSKRSQSQYENGNQQQQSLIRQNSYSSNNRGEINKQNLINYNSNNLKNIKQTQIYDTENSFYRPVSVTNKNSTFVNSYNYNSNSNSKLNNNINSSKSNLINIQSYSSMNDSRQNSTSRQEYNSSSSQSRDNSNSRNISKLPPPPPSYRGLDKIKNINNSNQSNSSNNNNNLCHGDISEISQYQTQQNVPKSIKTIKISNNQIQIKQRKEVNKSLLDSNNNEIDLKQFYNSNKLIDERRSSTSSKISNIKISEKQINSYNDNQFMQQFDSPLKSEIQSINMKPLIIQNQINDQQNLDNESQSKTFKSKLGIKIALRNLKKDVKKQQNDIKIVIEESQINNDILKNKNEEQNKRYDYEQTKEIAQDNNNKQQKQIQVNEIIEQNINKNNVYTNSLHQEVYVQTKALPPRSKNSYRSINGTAISNQSTTNQSFSSNPQINSSIESTTQNIIPNQYIQQNLEQFKMVRDSTNNIHEVQQMTKSNQRLYSQDTLFSQKIRKNSLDQDPRIYQAENEMLEYGEPQKTIHNESQESLKISKLEQGHSINSQFIQNQDTFLDNLLEKGSNQQSNPNFRVRRSQSFKK